MHHNILEFLPLILNLSLLQIVALISPGPDFAMVLRNSLIYSRKTALLTALGIAVGLIIHIIYIGFGVGIIIRQTVWLFNLLKYLGAGYLCYIGYKGLRAKKRELKLGDTNSIKDISSSKAFACGFFTNVLNPKCMLFCLSLISASIKPDTPSYIIIIFGIISFITTILWFSFVALCLTSKRIRNKFSSKIHIIERTTGIIMVLIGVKLAVA